MLKLLVHDYRLPDERIEKSAVRFFLLGLLSSIFQVIFEMNFGTNSSMNLLMLIFLVPQSFAVKNQISQLHAHNQDRLHVTLAVCWALMALQVVLILFIRQSAFWASLGLAGLGFYVWICTQVEDSKIKS